MIKTKKIKTKFSFIKIPNYTMEIIEVTLFTKNEENDFNNNKKIGDKNESI
jgi:hypothetical protein